MTFFFTVFATLLFILSDHGIIFAARNESISFGAIVNVKTHVGKELVVAMKLAAQYFNNISTHQNVSVSFRDFNGGPLQAAYAGLVFTFLTFYLLICDMNHVVTYR